MTKNGGPTAQRLSRNATRAGMAADRLRPLFPALGNARGLSAAPSGQEGGAEASRGGPLAPADNDRSQWKSRNPWTQAGEPLVSPNP